MWPVSERFAETLTRSHKLTGYAEILVDGLPELTTLGSSSLLLTAATAAVADGAVRRTATVELVDSAGVLVPVTEREMIVPGDGEIRLWAGVQYWDATPAEVEAGTDVEYCPVFTGPVLGYDLTDYPIIAVTCSDRMWYCRRPLTAPYTVTPATTVDDGIASLLAFTVPPSKLTTDLPTTDLVTGLIVADEQADPSDTLKRMATAAGWVLYADPMGTFVAETEPALDADRVAVTYAAGPGGALLRPRLTGTIEGVVNTWVVTGEAANATTAVPWAKVVDSDPASLTYVRGPYDERPRFISSPLLLTDAQCLLAAKTYQRREGGAADTVTAEVLPNPALEKGDVIQVTGGLVNRLVIADSFTLDLFGAQQEIVGRAGTVVGAD